MSTDDKTRIALVIGNASYVSARPLKNPIFDAEEIANTLSEIGFKSHLKDANGAPAKLTPYIDLSLSSMKKTLSEFYKASQKAEMAIIYFSGHGIEVGFSNYLIPIDAGIENLTDARYQAVPLSDLTSAAGQARQLRLVILDACRDNPLNESTKGLDAGQSLRVTAPHEHEKNSALVFYAAVEGKTAIEGVDLSPFATALVSSLRKKGLRLFDIFEDVTQQVRTNTKNRQEPRFYGAVSGSNLVLNPPPGSDTNGGESGGNDPGGGDKIDEPPPRPPQPPQPPKPPKDRLQLKWMALGGATAVALAIYYFWPQPVPIPPSPPIVPPSPQPVLEPGTNWTSAAPDAAYCFQRRDEAKPGPFLIRCFQTGGVCNEVRSSDSGQKTVCVFSTGLRGSSSWRQGSRPGGFRDSWYLYSGALVPPPFPQF